MLRMLTQMQSQQRFKVFDDIYDVQSVEVKPLAFGLKFVQIHVVMNDGEGLADALEGKISQISGVGEIEVLSMGLL